MGLASGATSEGFDGAGEVIAADETEAGRVRLAMRGSWFRQAHFGGTDVELTGVGSSFALAWSPTKTLTLAGQSISDGFQGTGMYPSSIQSLGDFSAAAVWTPIHRRGVDAGAHGGAVFLAGHAPLSGYGRTASPFLDGIATTRLGPIRASANAGLLFDRSEALVPDRAELTPPQRAAYGAADGSCARGAFAFDAPLAGGRLVPFAAWRSRLWFGGAAGGSSHTATTGVRFATAGATIDAGVDFGIRGGAVDIPRPIEPDRRFFAMLSLSFGPRSSVPAERVVENRPVEVAAAPTTGRAEGVVRDTRSGEPLASAIVEIPSVTENAILTDASGIYRFKDLPPGPQNVSVQKPGYLAATRAVEVRAGAVQTMDISLEPEVGRTFATFRGDVRSRDGSPIAARITFTSGKRKETVQADAAGKFQLSLPPGSVALNVEAAGFVPQAKTVTVTAGALTVYNFVLAPALP